VRFDFLFRYDILQNMSNYSIFSLVMDVFVDLVFTIIEKSWNKFYQMFFGTNCRLWFCHFVINLIFRWTSCIVNFQKNVEKIETSKFEDPEFLTCLVTLRWTSWQCGVYHRFEKVFGSIMENLFPSWFGVTLKIGFARKVSPKKRGKTNQNMFFLVFC
jgi:hypothetical protein